jgi:rhamnogalacturonan endolyase
MGMKRLSYCSVFLMSILLVPPSVMAQRQMEKLNRGVIALRKGPDSVYIGWRMLGTDPDDIAFNVYLQSGKKNKVRLNAKPVTLTTDFIAKGVDPEALNIYTIKPVLKGIEQQESEGFAIAANDPATNYLTIPLKTPTGYTPNDISVGDLDGDGTYEIILHQTGRSRDNSSNGYTDPAIFQAYRMDGTLLWEINLGKNIREGAHYTQFMVYDLDGDGIAEFACKTADGTTDGKGKVIGDGTKDWRNVNGKILSGPEYFTIFNGKTGEALATTDYIPGRGITNGWGGPGGNGGNDDSGNRVDRFTACVAYLDGKHPSVPRILRPNGFGSMGLARW